MIKHWGEYEKPPKEKPVIDLSQDIEKSMDPNAFSEVKIACKEPEPQEITLNPRNPYVKHAIALHKYANDMPEKIRVAELAIESNVILPKDTALPHLKMPKVRQRHARNNLNYIPKRFTSFSKGKPKVLCEISGEVAKLALDTSTATMLAHIGFETTHQSVLTFVSDVLEQFLKTVGHKLKVAIEDEAANKSFGFPHPLERVLTQIGVGNFSELHDFYQTRIIKYAKVLRKRCVELNGQYERVISSNTFALDIIKNPIITDESMEVESTEINPTDLETDVGMSTLETGFQLLNSLEAQENLMEEGEELTALHPNLVSVLESDKKL